MSVKIMTWVWESAPSDLNPSELLILLALADHANDDGLAYPSQRHLGDKCRLTRVTANRAISKLCARGLVEKLYPLGPGTPVWVYKIHFDGHQGIAGWAPNPGQTHADQRGQGGVLKSYRGVIVSTPQEGENGGGGVLKSYTEPKDKNKELKNTPPPPTGGAIEIDARATDGTEGARGAESVPEGFGAFWTAYPRSRDRNAALRAFQAATKRGATPGQLLLAAQRYASKIKKDGTDDRFVKYPATWLNAGSYEDFAQKPKPPDTRPLAVKCAEIRERDYLLRDMPDEYVAAYLEPNDPDLPDFLRKVEFA